MREITHRLKPLVFHMLLRAVLFLLCLSSMADNAEAGFHVSPALSCATFSFEPSAAENTPNYYALGPDISLAYSFAELFDLGVYGHYFPGKRGAPELFQEDAALFGYGAQMAFRIARQFFAGARFGAYNYNLLRAGDENEDVDGRWMGNGVGLGFGIMYPLRSNQAAQINIEYMRPLLSAVDEPSLDDRYLGLLQINFVFKFSGQKSSSRFDRFFNRMFKGWGL